MKRLLAAALLGCLPALLQAQERSAPAAANSAATAAASAPAFELEIQAPDQIRDLLQRHLDLLRYRDVGDLSDSELARLLTVAEQDARELVATLGYFSPAIRFEQTPADGAVGTRSLQLHVVPGEPTLVTDATVEFQGPIAGAAAARQQRQQIEANWSLRPGMRFTQAGWDSAKQQALRQLVTQRYPAGQLTTSLADIDPVSHRAHLSVTLDSGPAYQLGPLIVSGTQRYDAELVTRLARLSPGADYQQAQLVQAQQRLADSGYFDSAVVTLDTQGDPQAAPVQIQVREAPLQKLVFGLGASTDSGPRFSLEHTHHRVPGIDWRAVSKFRIDRDTRALGTELTAPPDAGNWRWVTAAQWQNQQLGSFGVTSLSLRGGRSQIGDRFDRSYFLQYDRADTATSDVTAPAVASALSANYAVTLRNFDSVPFPSRGWGLGLEAGGGMTLNHQRNPYGRILTRWLSYRPLAAQRDDGPPAMRAGRLVLRAEAGMVIARDDIDVPSTQLFLSGGDSSVRGYDFRQIGVTLPDGKTTAGRYLTVGSLEWQRPIMRNGRLSDWEGTVFIDAGAVADKPAELKAKVGVGVGARWKSPVGPLQIDLAYGVATQRVRLHLNVGFTF